MTHDVPPSKSPRPPVGEATLRIPESKRNPTRLSEVTAQEFPADAASTDPGRDIPRAHPVGLSGAPTDDQHRICPDVPRLRIVQDGETVELEDLIAARLAEFNTMTEGELVMAIRAGSNTRLVLIAHQVRVCHSGDPTIHAFFDRTDVLSESIQAVGVEVRSAAEKRLRSWT